MKTLYIYVIYSGIYFFLKEQWYVTLYFFLMFDLSAYLNKTNLFNSYIFPFFITHLLFLFNQKLYIKNLGVFYLIFFFNYIIEVQLIYNVVLISAVQQMIQVSIYYTFFFTMVYHRILNIVPCTIKQDLVVYSVCNSLHLLTPNSPSLLSQLHFSLRVL